MKVKELIKQLQSLPIQDQESRVVLEIVSESHGFEIRDVTTIQAVENKVAILWYDKCYSLGPQ